MMVWSRPLESVSWTTLLDDVGHMTVEWTSIELELLECVVHSHQEDVELGYVEVGVGSEGEGWEDGESETMIPVVPLADLTCRVVSAAAVDGGERVVGTV